MKVRLMKVYNPYLQKMVWVPRELFEANFSTNCVIREDDLTRHQINMADLYNRAEKRGLK